LTGAVQRIQQRNMDQLRCYVIAKYKTATATTVDMTLLTN